MAIAISCADNHYSIKSFEQLTAVRKRAAAAAPDAPPILVTNSRHDPSTPHESAGQRGLPAEQRGAGDGNPIER